MSVFTCLQPKPWGYNHWVHVSFRQTLLDDCDKFLQSIDRGKDKTCSKLITQVSNKITNITKEKKEILPDDLEKVESLLIFNLFLMACSIQCVCIWYGNYATGNAKEYKPPKSKVDTHGYPTTTRTWTVKTVCGHIFMECVTNEQKRLSNVGKQDISNYRPALVAVFEALSGAEVKECEYKAELWNT